jgi:hypothetical protein
MVPLGYQIQGVTAQKAALEPGMTQRGLRCTKARLPVGTTGSTIGSVPSVDKIVKAMRINPRNVAYNDLFKVCQHHFGKPRQDGTSHAVFKTPWPGDPRVNIQKDKGKAKAYQVRQVLAAIDKKETM